MKVIRSLWLCVDCMYANEYGDLTGLTAERAEEVTKGVAKLGKNLVASSERLDWTRIPCGCCGITDAGQREHYSILGE